MIDLHLHLDGSLEPDELLYLAENSGVAIPTNNLSELRGMLSVTDDCKDLKEYLDKFDLPLKMLQTETALEQAVYMLIKRLSLQGLCYAEIRFAPQLHLTKGLTQKRVVAAAIKGLNKAVNEFKMPAQLILCCMRMQNNISENIETVEAAREYMGKGVCAVDLAGNEAAFPTENFKDVFNAAANDNIPIIIHAGEAAGDESISQALDMGAVRIGHGIHAAENESVIKRLKENQIPLEICYTSNLQTKAVNLPCEHPIKYFIEKGLIVTVNTDNMTVSDTTLKKEYMLIKKQFNFTDNELMQLAINSAKSSFLPEAEQLNLIDNIKNNFEKWIS